MAREHARILCSIWSPQSDFRRRSPGAQRLYFVILSQRELNNAGVIPLMVSKWARCSVDTTAADVETDLEELEQHRYVVVDRETDEVLVRTFVRNDGIAKQPNMLKSALRAATQIESAELRSALAVELLRIGHPAATETAREIAPATHHGTLSGTPSDGIAEGHAETSSTDVEEPSADPSSTSVEDPCGVGEGEGEGGTSSFRGGRVGGRASAPPPPAPQPLRDPNNPRCAQHRDIPATERGPNCRACAAVRREVENAPELAAIDAKAEAAARRALIQACEVCDDNGMRSTSVGLARCTHPELVEAS